MKKMILTAAFGAALSLVAAESSVPVFGEPQYDPAKTPIANLLAIQRAVDACASPCVVVEPLPRGLTPDDPAREDWDLSARQVYKLCDTNRIFFLELKWCFLEKDKTLKSAFYEPDGLSLNAAGRAEYAKRIKPLVDWVAAPSGKCPASSFGYKSDKDGARIHFRRDARQNYARWWWDRTVGKLAEADALRAAGGNLDLLFVGDSLTHRWEYEDSGAPVLKKLTDKYRVLNVAIGGDRWEQQLWMVKSGMIDGLKPRYVSILLGANNHNYRWTKDSPERTRDGVKEIIDAVRKKCPNAQFILYPMLMRLSDDPNTQTNRANDIATCPLLRELAEKEGARWVEFDQEMRKAIGGTDELKKKYTTDFTHLSRYMFEKWYEALEPVLSPRVPTALCDHAEPVNLPELLRTKDGRRISSVADWEARRVELLDYFTRNIYGVRPVERPADLAFTPVEPDRDMPEVPAIRRRAKISFSGPRGKWSFNACVFLPRNASSARPAPAFVLICNRSMEKFADIDRAVKSDFFPVEEIVRRGYAAAIFKNTELASDAYFPTYAADGTAVIQDPPFTNDVYACWAPERTRESWGAISVWAWGASRVLDWLETMPEVDAKRVAVVGHSRGGKTSLWAVASDSRFAMACVNDSGCCGAKLNHVAVSQSEMIQQDNNNNPHWFARSYRQFNGKDAWLPYDQHWIAALVAPRLLYIASASQDIGAGPWGEFLTARHASPAWELYGKKGLVEDHPYAIETPFAEGSVGYHLRRGGHNLARYDWDRYMDFADRHMKGKGVPK